MPGSPTNVTFTDYTTVIDAVWLNFVNGVVNSPNLTSYTAPYTGAVTRTVPAKLSDTVSVLDFGADPTGTLTSTGAIQAALNTGRTIYFPAGTYLCGALTMSAGGMVGDGIGQTILQCNDNTGADFITHTGTGNFGPVVPYFANMTILASLSKTAGYAINFLPGTGELDFIYMENVTIENFISCVHFKAAASFKLRGCNFINFLGFGINIENVVTPDSGDSFISDCLINTGRLSGSTYAIYHQSSGGLKVSNVKINGCDDGYVIAWNQTSSADVMFNNVSIENFTGFGMFFSRVSGTGQVGSCTFNNMEFLGPNGIGTDGSGVLILATFSNIVFDTTSATATAMLLSNLNAFTVDNIIFNNVSGGNPIAALSITSSCSNGKVSNCVYNGYTGANAFVNGSASVFYQPTVQHGVATITASTAYGSLFTGSTTVTFPAAYLVAPTVTCYPTTTGGAISAFPQNITTTGFTMIGIDINSGGTMANNGWEAKGIL